MLYSRIWFSGISEKNSTLYFVKSTFLSVFNLTIVRLDQSFLIFPESPRIKSREVDLSVYLF